MPKENWSNIHKTQERAHGMAMLWSSAKSLTHGDQLASFFSAT